MIEVTLSSGQVVQIGNAMIVPIVEGALYFFILCIIITHHFQKLDLIEQLLDFYYSAATSNIRVVCFGCSKRSCFSKKELQVNENIWNCRTCLTTNIYLGKESVPLKHDECLNPGYCLLCTSNNRSNQDMVQNRKQIHTKSTSFWQQENVFCRECLHNQKILISALSYDAPPVRLDDILLIAGKVF